MPIKGLTNRTQTADTGKPVRLGFLQKGWREGFGRNIKLHDADYFIFKPAGNDHESEKIHNIFKRVYGEQPRSIDDVRIPVGIAGNFDMANCAWLTASKHTEQGSVFLARSDGEYIKQARDPKNGKIKFHFDGEMPFADTIEYDKRGKECYPYQGKLYPFVQQMMIDLTLPELNRALYAEGLTGSGTVTFITHSTWDIANMMDEYNAILDEIVGVFNDGSRSPNVMRNWICLRDIPLRIFRSEDKISTPAWKNDAKPGDRYSDTRDLVHWQLNPEFAAAVQEARDQRTQLTLQAIASAPMLMAGRSEQSPQQRLADANNAFFDTPMPELGEGEETDDVTEDTTDSDFESGPDWDALSEIDEVLEGEVDGEFVEDRQVQEDLEPAGGANDMAVGPASLASQLYEGQLYRNAFDDENHIVRAITYILDGAEYDPMFDQSLSKALAGYANGIADGGSPRESADASRKMYQEAVMVPF